MTFEILTGLMKQLVSVKPQNMNTATFSFDNQTVSYFDLEETFRDGLNSLAGTYQLWRKNKDEIFTLMEQMIDEITPKFVDRYSQFAQIKFLGQGQKPIFKIPRRGKVRAKKNFVVRGALAGYYEVFKLDEDVIEIPTAALTAACQMGLEEFLDGRANLAEMLEILMEGMDEKIQDELGTALETLITQVGTQNKIVTNAFDEVEMDRAIAVVESYGQVATIYCTKQFASTIHPTNSTDIQWSETMKDEYYRNGFLGTYKGTRIILIPQSVTDESNKEFVVNPQFAYIFGANKQPVFLAFEGDTIIDEFKNRDRSTDILMYKKFGLALHVTPDMFVYQNVSIHSGVSTSTPKLIGFNQQ